MKVHVHPTHCTTQIKCIQLVLTALCCYQLFNLILWRLLLIAMCVIWSSNQYTHSQNFVSHMISHFSFSWNISCCIFTFFFLLKTWRLTINGNGLTFANYKTNLWPISFQDCNFNVKCKHWTFFCSEIYKYASF